MTGEVLSDGSFSEKFNVSNGVKQGFVLAPVLFNLFSLRCCNTLSKTSTTVKTIFRISESIKVKVFQAQLRWTGHLICMEVTRIPRQLFYGELTSGSRYRKRKGTRTI
jgi:hypothetical protein